jgi:hypothetical protein
MIVTRLIGGLGNQLFQYAAGRALSIKNSSDLLLDISNYSTYKLHQGYQLEKIFTGKFKVASDSDVKEIIGSPNIAKLKCAFYRATKLTRRRGIIIEPGFSYWCDFPKVQDESYISGYWQSEKYFLDYHDEILNDLRFKSDFNDLNLDVLDKLKSSNKSVSIHIRRGDYLKNPRALATHGLLPMSYYKSAVEYIERVVGYPHYYIFSDDIEWVKTNLKLNGNHTFITHNLGENSYMDMMLMTFCSHHIIANSSFSWWGAWLNPSKDKIVIAPKRWFANNLNDLDLIPESWIRI